MQARVVTSKTTSRTAATVADMVAAEDTAEDMVGTVAAVTVAASKADTVAPVEAMEVMEATVAMALPLLLLRRTLPADMTLTRVMVQLTAAADMVALLTPLLLLLQTHLLVQRGTIGTQRTRSQMRMLVAVEADAMAKLRTTVVAIPACPAWAVLLLLLPLHMVATALLPRHLLLLTAATVAPLLLQAMEAMEATEHLLHLRHMEARPRVAQEAELVALEAVVTTTPLMPVVAALTALSTRLTTCTFSLFVPISSEHLFYQLVAQTGSGCFDWRC